MWKIQNAITDAVQVSFIIFFNVSAFFITSSQFFLLYLAKPVPLFSFPEKSYLGTQGFVVGKLLIWSSPFQTDGEAKAFTLWESAFVSGE